jgi:hypothetical protein
MARTKNNDPGNVVRDIPSRSLFGRMDDPERIGKGFCAE